MERIIQIVAEYQRRQFPRRWVTPPKPDTSVRFVDRVCIRPRCVGNNAIASIGWDQNAFFRRIELKTVKWSLQITNLDSSNAER
jgi:hypothetical protein